MLAHGTPILPLVKTFILLFVCTLQECGVFTWRVSDCEVLVGVTHRRWWGLFFVCDSIETLWCSI